MWSLLQTQEPLTHLPLNVQSLGQRSWAIVSTIGGIVGVVSLVVSFELTVMFSIITSLHSFINIETAPIAKDRSPVNCKEKENATLLPSTTTVGEVNMQTYNTDLFENHAVNIIELYTIFLNWYRSTFFLKLGKPFSYNSWLQLQRYFKFQKILRKLFLFPSNNVFCSLHWKYPKIAMFNLWIAQFQILSYA